MTVAKEGTTDERATGAPVRARAERYYRPELDWLRFMAFALVFTLHAFPSDPAKYTLLGIPHWFAQIIIAPLVRSGGYGVDLFFALSAFLITELLLREKDATGTVHVKAFYLRRILRIWPLYIAFIVAVLPFEVLWLGVPFSYHVALLAFTGNWYIVLFGGFPSLCGNLWSVCVEEQFYIVWPNLMARARTKRFAKMLIGIFAFTCIYRIIYVYSSPALPIAVWYNTLTRLDGFALGGLLACALHGRTLVLPFVTRAAIFLAALAIFWGIGHAPIGGYFGESPAWTYPLAAIASVLLIFAFTVLPTRTTMGRPLRLLSYLGKISYGLYVFHGPALRFSDYAAGDAWPSPEWAWLCHILFAGTLTVLISMVSYAVLEEPFLRMKRRFTLVESRPE